MKVTPQRVYLAWMHFFKKKAGIKQEPGQPRPNPQSKRINKSSSSGSVPRWELEKQELLAAVGYKPKKTQHGSRT